MHWLDRVQDIYSADTPNLRELALSAGGDPANFYLGTDLRGADIRGQDLRGMQFSRISLRDLQWDYKTKLDIFDTDRDAEALRNEKVIRQVYRINGMRRQEERLCAYMELVIDVPELIVEIDKVYREKSKFSLNGNRIFKENLRYISKKDVLIVYTVEKILKNAFPTNRDYFVFYSYRYFQYLGHNLRRVLRSKFSFGSNLKKEEFEEIREFVSFPIPESLVKELSGQVRIDSR